MNVEELGNPQVIEELSLDEILRQMKQKLIEIDEKYTAYVESDPLVKLIEVAAYRLLRQREAAQSNLLAFATGSDLDNLADVFGMGSGRGELGS